MHIYYRYNMKIKVAINGFGRIGRLAFKNLIENDEVEVVAINDLADAPMLAHLLKYDSSQGRFGYDVEVKDHSFLINGQEIKVYKEEDPVKLPWHKLGVETVLESSGVFLTREKANKHIEAGAKRVVLSAPAKSEDIRTIVLGVNEEELKDGDTIVSNASCTTNCLSPMVKVMNDTFGIEKGQMTTVHAYTQSQQLQDAPHKKDMRRARAAAVSIIPTSTGATKALELVMPEMKGKLDGYAMRVPVITGSITDCSFILSRETTVEEVNQAMKKAAGHEMKGILEYTTDPIVSVDIIGNKHSCIFDADLTKVNGELVKICGWYDNEAGYAARLAELLVKFSKLAGENS